MANLMRTDGSVQYALQDGGDVGGMATVYAAQLPTGKKFALKVFNLGTAEVCQENARREFKAITAAATRFGEAWPSQWVRPSSNLIEVQNPNVPGQTWPAYELEWVELPALDGVWKATHADRSMFEHVFCSILQAVREGHVKGVFHLDLHPKNVRFDAKAGRWGSARLIDCGLARTAPPSGQQSSKVTSRAGPGALVWSLDPDEAIREGRVAPDQRSDIYALGHLGHALATGGHPAYKATRDDWTGHNYRYAEIVPYTPREMKGKGVPAELVSLIRDMTDPEVAKRPRDLDEVLDRFNKAIDAGKRRTGAWMASVAASSVLVAGALLWAGPELFPGLAEFQKLRGRIAELTTENAGGASQVREEREARAKSERDRDDAVGERDIAHKAEVAAAERENKAVAAQARAEKDREEARVELDVAIEARETAVAQRKRAEEERDAAKAGQITESEARSAAEAARGEADRAFVAEKKAREAAESHWDAQERAASDAESKRAAAEVAAASPAARDAAGRVGDGPPGVAGSDGSAIGGSGGGPPASTVCAALDLQLGEDAQGNPVSLGLVGIPAGSFLMGSATGASNEMPVHRVWISEPFYLGRYEITQAQWEAVMGDNPSYFKGPGHPVDSVPWDMCQEFIKRLGKKAPGRKLSLPTEAQWEYACRAGTTTRFSFGDDVDQLSEFAWYGGFDAIGHPVGEKKPNAWGLYDMHGNVWEWVSSQYVLYPNKVVFDPKGPSTANSGVVRGGSWINSSTYLRSACRSPRLYKSTSEFDVGIRLAMSAVSDTPVAAERENKAATAQQQAELDGPVDAKEAEVVQQERGEEKRDETKTAQDKESAVCPAAAALVPAGAAESSDPASVLGGREFLERVHRPIDVRFAPDGAWVCFVSNVNSPTERSRNELWRADCKGGEFSRLVALPQDTMWPEVSPDGSRVAFQIADVASATNRDVLVVATAGGTPRGVGNTLNDEWRPCWRSDGLLTLIRKHADSSDLVFLGAEYREVALLPLGDVCGAGEFSPDGRWYYVLRKERGHATAMVRFAVPASPAGPIEPKEEVLERYDDGRISDLWVSPDGRRIAYDCKVLEGVDSIFLFDVEGKRSRLWFAVNAMRLGFSDFAPDGKQAIVLYDLPDPTGGESAIPGCRLIDLPGVAYSGESAAGRSGDAPPASVLHKVLDIKVGENAQGENVWMDLVLIRPGCFVMGSETGDSDEVPMHRVQISEPFYLGKYEVTQAQWEALMQDNPSYFRGPKNPVESVTWDMCQEFIKRLGKKAPGRKFSLPTEAQWEYACRAGTTTRYSFGDNEKQLSTYAWCDVTSGTNPVGEKKPNAWGLYDMHGNVWEWVNDRHASYPDMAFVTDPTGHPSGNNYRVLRGGGWKPIKYSLLGCANRYGTDPDLRNTEIGFRVVMAAETK